MTAKTNATAMFKSIKANIAKGDKFFKNGEFKDAISAYSKSIKRLGTKIPNQNYRLLLADAYNGMGHTLRSMAQLESAKKFQEKALKIYKSSVHPGSAILQEKFATSSHYMGDVLAELGHVDKALKHYNDELQIARKLYAKNSKKYLDLLINGLNGTASRLADKKNYKKALSLLNESKKLILNAPGNLRKKYPSLSWTYHLMGTTHLKKGNVDGAIKNLQTSLKMRITIARENKAYIRALKNTLNKLGDAFAQKGVTKTADKYYRETLKIVQSKTYKAQVVSTKFSTEAKQLKAKMLHLKHQRKL